MSFTHPEMLQYPAEIDRLVEIMLHEDVRSYLEIGSQWGGSLWHIGSVLPRGSLIVSVNLPAKPSEKSLTSTIAALRGIGQDARVLWGDSRAPSVIAAARRLAPFDAIMLDADHRMPTIMYDWDAYFPMVRPGGIMALHDIAWKRPPDWDEGKRIDVPIFWDRIKRDFQHEEIKLDPGKRDNGIGVIYRGRA